MTIMPATKPWYDSDEYSVYIQQLIQDMRDNDPLLKDRSDEYVANLIHDATKSRSGKPQNYKPVEITQVERNQIRQVFREFHNTLKTLYRNQRIPEQRTWISVTLVIERAVAHFGSDVAPLFTSDSATRQLGHRLSRFYQLLGLERSPLKYGNRWKYRLRPKPDQPGGK